MNDISDKLNYSDFDIFKIVIGEYTFIFEDEEKYFECLNSLEFSDFSSLCSDFKNSVITPLPLSVAVASSLGVSNPPVLSSWG